ncbi:hypothetical protein [Arthrobacter cavernae]|uniref:Uncharacterized protein n=1 Tax=Arthrobacter cavernae TaxID=2817681 RepID=A0A939KLB9_9MICC|nr:hypothetical protein [Arthrobacter cavernae]MBO1267088.1 hypothetical protein [Arthrobacter cavernae]
MAEISSVRSGFIAADVTGNKTLTAADSGVVQRVTANATITLPSTALGLTFAVQAGVTTAGKLPTISVAPAALDGVTGNGFTAAVNKAISLDTTAGRTGDLFIIRGTGTAGVTGWVVDSVIGTWTRAA